MVATLMVLGSITYCFGQLCKHVFIQVCDKAEIMYKKRNKGIAHVLKLSQDQAEIELTSVQKDPIIEIGSNESDPMCDFNGKCECENLFNTKSNICVCDIVKIKCD